MLKLNVRDRRVRTIGVVSTWVAAATIMAAACGSSPARESAVADAPPVSAASSTPAEPKAAAREARPRVVVLGDSLTAGLGLNPAEAFPSLIQNRIDAAGMPFEVVNMGVSGDTSAGGLRRVEWALEGDVRVLIVALGGNDGLRGLAPEELGRNLERIIDIAKARDIQVILCGMEAPPNFGESYTSGFRAVFRTVAERKQVVLLPFLLEGVAGDPSLNQPDGIHPNVEGARRVADLVWTRLEPLLATRGTR